MTCVPVSILKALRSEFRSNGVHNLSDFQTWVRTECKSAPLEQVRVNGEVCSDSFYQECRQALVDFKSNANGQWVSACDPLIILVCAGLQVSIEHTFTKRKTLVLYEWMGDSDAGPTDERKIVCIQLKSNDGHMWSAGRKSIQNANGASSASSSVASSQPRGVTVNATGQSLSNASIEVPTVHVNHQGARRRGRASRIRRRRRR